MIEIRSARDGGWQMVTDGFLADIAPARPQDFQPQIRMRSLFCPRAIYVRDASGAWRKAATGTYAYLKIGFERRGYAAGIWIHDRDTIAGQLGRWGAVASGVSQTSAGREAWLRSTWSCRHPVSDDGHAMGLTIEVTTQWRLLEGAAELQRFDDVRVSQPVYDVQLNHFGEVGPPGFARGLVKTYVADCESKAGWSWSGGVGAGMALREERMVGYKSLKFTALQGSKGARFQRSLPGEDWSRNHHLALYVRPRDSNVLDAIRFFVVDALGGRQYVGNPVSLSKDWMLNEDRRGHTLTGRWRQVHIDLSETTRGDVTAFGFEVLTDQLVDFWLDDVWRFGVKEWDLSAQSSLDEVHPVTTWPLTYRDARAFPDWPTERAENFDKLSYYPFFTFFSTNDQASGVAQAPWRYTVFYDSDRTEPDGYWQGARITWRPGASNAGRSYLVTSWEHDEARFGVSDSKNKIWEGDGYRLEQRSTTGWLAFAMMVKNKYSVQCGVKAGYDSDGGAYNLAGTRAVGRLMDAALTTYAFESIYRAAWCVDRAAGHEAMLERYLAWDAPECAHKTEANLPDVNRICRLIQANPQDRYLMREWLRDMLHRWREVGAGTVQPGMTPGIVFYRSRDAWLLNTPWDSTMTDNKIDYVQLWVDLVKNDQGLPLVIESTAAVPEGETEIPHYNQRHIATLEDGSLFRLRFWVYESEDGYFVVRYVPYDDFTPSYYEPWVYDGRTYSLSYSYALNGASLASAYGTREEFGEKTIGDMRLEQIEYVCQWYDIDCITLAEDCTFYHHGSYGSEDLKLWNHWRQFVRQPPLPPMDGFPRPDLTRPASRTNKVRADDEDVWSWKNWLIQRFIAKARDICHRYGVLLMVDFNLESTLPTVDRYAPVYDQDPWYWRQDKLGDWYTRQYDLWGRRYGTDIREVMRIADLGYLWNYGAFSPWGYAECYRDFLDFLRGQGYEGRLLFGAGLYPDDAPPGPEDLRDTIIASAAEGYGAVVPTTRQFGGFQHDYLWYVDQAFQTIPDATLDGDVLRCPHTKGVYFPKARPGLSLDVPAATTVRQYDRAQTLKAIFAPYAGEIIDVAAGDSLTIITGRTPGYAIKPVPYVSPVNLGIGMLADIILDICLDAGMTAADIDTTELPQTPVWGVVLDSVPRRSLESLQAAFFFDVVESGGRLKFRPRGAAPVVDIPEDDLVVEGDSPRVEITRTEDLSLPREIAIGYFDPGANYQAGTQRARRLVTPSRSDTKTDLNLAISADTAKRIADKTLACAWTARNAYAFALPRKYAFLEPGDAVRLMLGGVAHVVRILEMTQDLDQFQVKGESYDSAALDSSAVGATGLTPDNTLPAYVAATAVLLDLPLLPGVDDAFGLYALVTGSANRAAWPSATLYASFDGGITWTDLRDFLAPGVVGQAVTALPAGPVGRRDPWSVVRVTLPGMQLYSHDWLSVYAGANAGLVGGEIIQWRRAELQADGSYLLSGLLRGLCGTEAAVGEHEAGERFIPLEAGNLAFVPLAGELRNRELLFRAVTSGLDLERQPTVPCTPQGASLAPLAPCHVRGYRRANGDIEISWTRRARQNGNWTDGADVPLDEPAELYALRVFDGEEVVRRVDGLGTPRFTYTAAMQGDDFGGPAPRPLKVTVGQVSSRVGEGAKGAGWIE